ncbi:MAG: EAL domain-containing protein [Comamonas sp.]
MDLHYLRHQPATQPAPSAAVRVPLGGQPCINLVQMQAMADCLPQPVWLQGTATQAAHLNPAWQKWSGNPDNNAAPQVWTAQVHSDDRPKAEQAWQLAQSDQQALSLDCRLRHHSGTFRCCRVQISLSGVNSEASPVWMVSATDIHDHTTAAHALRSDIRAQTQMLDVSVDCIKIIRPDGSLSHMNKSGCNALGVAADSGFGMQWLNLLPPEIRQRGKRALRTAITGKNARFSGMSAIPNQKPQYWDNILTPVKSSDGSVSAILCVSRDITEQREAELHMRDASEQDDLTGLPNRRAFKTRIKQIIKHSRENELMFGVMLLDLDHFKHINDTLGHVAGDHLLRVLSRRLFSLLPDSSVLARLGGDEFAIAIRHIADAKDLLNLAELVRQQINAPITYAGKPINGGMSIGCALYPRDAKDTLGLLKCADTALNDMKATGRGGVRLFNRNMHEAAMRAASQVNQARAIVRDRLVVPYYQPKVNIDTGAIVGFEALLRWQGADGVQTPNTVAEAFKDYELATRIGDAMQTKVFTDIASWLANGTAVHPISINAAPVEFLRDDFAERMLKRLHQFHIPVHLIELEITEYILGDRGSEYVARALQQLKKAGVRIALDDFGTGHSSFTDLRDYPVDCLKIDKSFVQRMTQERPILAIVKAMCQLGADLSLDIVAEGIETQEQRAVLMVAGCRIGQGYLFGRAMSSEQAEQLLKQPVT